MKNKLQKQISVVAAKNTQNFSGGFYKRFPIGCEV